MNNKGFALIETIIMIVILLTTLVVLYSSYSNIIINEKKRLYYDDIAYVYRSFSIKNALDVSVDQEKFENAFIDNNSYIYFFSTGSNIYYDKRIIEKAKDLYHFTGLGYFKIHDLENIKDCIKNTSNDVKCTSMLDAIYNNNYTNLDDYLLQLNIPHDDNYKHGSLDGVLLTMIYETKNGDGHIVNAGRYEECIEQKVIEHYHLPTNASQQEIESRLNEYYNDPKLDFEMSCQNAYYLSWVYL